MMRVGVFATALIVVAFLTAGGLASAQNVQKKSTVRGAGIGALLGQAIGHDTEGTLVGGVLGAGVGYVVGDKKEKAQSTKTLAPPPAPAQAPAPAAKPESKKEPQPGEEKPPVPKDKKAETADPADALYGDYWAVKSVSPKDRVPPFFSKLAFFLPDGRLQTLTTSPEGHVTLSEEFFSTVDDTLVVKKPDYVIQARYKVEGDQLILSAEDFSVVLERVRPE